MDTGGREQQLAAARKFREQWRAVDARRPRNRSAKTCQGGGFTVMATSRGPVTVPCVCCGGGAS
ncbi:hypothetical protein [Streptomyces sp. DW26H14]|uniref:hypothetical protein n=1 Tax=Streptomyces sp. DW26H14 TaxID=3435395 RepID=UPI00403D5A26